MKKWRDTPQSQHRFPIAANTLDRAFTVEALKWGASGAGRVLRRYRVEAMRVAS